MPRSKEKQNVSLGHFCRFSPAQHYVFLPRKKNWLKRNEWRYSWKHPLYLKALRATEHCSLWNPR